MREVVHRSCQSRVWTLALLTVALCRAGVRRTRLGCVVAGAGPRVLCRERGRRACFAGGGRLRSPSPSPSPVSATLTCALSSASVVFGDQVTVSGVLDPAAEAQEVVVTLGGVEVGRPLTDASGAYSLTFTPHRGGDVVAALAADPAIAGPRRSAGRQAQGDGDPRHARAVPHVDVRRQGDARRPTTASSCVKVAHRGVVVGTYKAAVGKATLCFRCRCAASTASRSTYVLPAGDGLTGRSLQAKVSVRAKTLSVGASGPYVKGMLTALRACSSASRREQQLHEPGQGLGDGLPEGVPALAQLRLQHARCWRKLDGAKIIKPRYVSPATHIEIDKGRQILMIVKGGKPWGIICVSTGATGNTPEGLFHIQQKHPYTSSGFGGTLTRTMGFQGDFAIHGWPDVPPYPASHGCVREPIWACYWTYDNSWVGETVYVYH